jgi:serine/threonine protein kinase
MPVSQGQRSLKLAEIRSDPGALASLPPTSPRHQVIGLLDEGGMARVFLAHTRGDDGAPELVVIKHLRSYAAREPELCRMFLDEVRLGARLSHPNVVRTHELIEHADTVSLVMEYLEGQSYARARKRLAGSLSAGRMLALHLFVLEQVLAGLSYAHGLCDAAGEPAHVVHGDVSPPNVMLTYDGGVKLLDFGIAQHATMRGPSAQLGAFRGKIGYASPEQAAGAPLDARTDVFAAGVMLWEAVAGRRLWQDTGTDLIFARLAQGAWPHLSEVAPASDAGLARLCAWSMALDPARRPASAAALREALLAHARDRGLEMAAPEAGALLAAAYADERAALRAEVEAHLGRGHATGTFSTG